VGLWGSERGNAVFKVSTIAFTTICRSCRCKVSKAIHILDGKHWTAE
jgi:hypothetical protein